MDHLIQAVIENMQNWNMATNNIRQMYPDLPEAAYDVIQEIEVCRDQLIACKISGRQKVLEALRIISELKLETYENIITQRDIVASLRAERKVLKRRIKNIKVKIGRINKNRNPTDVMQTRVLEELEQTLHIQFETDLVDASMRIAGFEMMEKRFKALGKQQRILEALTEFD